MVTPSRSCGGWIGTGFAVDVAGGTNSEGSCCVLPCADWTGGCCFRMESKRSAALTFLGTEVLDVEVVVSTTCFVLLRRRLLLGLAMFLLMVVDVATAGAGIERPNSLV
jgi:hypothetical protein